MQFITSGDRIATENFTLGRIYTVTFNNGNYFINTCIGIGPDYVMFQQTAPKMLFRLDMETAANVDTIDESGGGSGTTNYNELDNKPQINGVILQGNKTLGDLSIYPVPIVTSEDNNKILTASYVGGSGSYSWQPAPSSGTTNYNDLNNKPQINSIELSGNKSLSDFGIQGVISDLDTIRSGAAAGATAVQPGTLSGYQTLIDSSHKLSSDLVDDDGHDNKFATAAQLAQIETNKNNISTANAELIELVDNGAKNLADIEDSSGSRWIDKPLSLSAGTYRLYFGSLTSNATGTTCQVLLINGSTILDESYCYPARGNNTSAQFILNSDCTSIRIYAGGSYSESVDKNISFTNIMVCSKAAWDVSQKYVPYAPTNAELYEMIKALQS